MCRMQILFRYNKYIKIIYLIIQYNKIICIFWNVFFMLMFILKRSIVYQLLSLLDILQGLAVSHVGKSGYRRLLFW